MNIFCCAKDDFTNFLQFVENKRQRNANKIQATLEKSKKVEIINDDVNE